MPEPLVIEVTVQYNAEVTTELQDQAAAAAEQAVANKIGEQADVLTRQGVIRSGRNEE